MPWTSNLSFSWSKPPSWQDMLAWRRGLDTAAPEPEEPEVELPRPPEEPEVELPEPPEVVTPEVPEEPGVELPRPPEEPEEPEVELPRPPEEPEEPEDPEVEPPEPPEVDNGGQIEPVSLSQGATAAVAGGRVTVFAVDATQNIRRYAEHRFDPDHQWPRARKCHGQSRQHAGPGHVGQRLQRSTLVRL